MRISKFYKTLVAHVLQMIADHPATHFTASQLAERLGVGSTQLKKAFKEITGYSLYAYQLKEKLTYASVLIIADELPIKMIAKKCGFRNASNFTTAFKKQFKLTPAQYRAANDQAG